MFSNIQLSTSVSFFFNSLLLMSARHNDIRRVANFVSTQSSPTDSPSTAPPAGMTPPPRERVPRACEHCRARKIKCNGQQPCNACARHPERCLYRTGSIRQRKNRRTKEAPRPPATLLPLPTTDSPTTPSDWSHTSLSDGPAQYKRHHELRAGIGVQNPETGAFQFYGPSSGFCFIHRVYQRIKQGSSSEPLLARRSCSIPDAIHRFGLERFMFARPGDSDPRRTYFPSQMFLPRELGDQFIEAYFRIMHPQIPILIKSEIDDAWNQMWESPVRDHSVKNQDILFMVLAIGARVANLKGKQTESSVAAWADYFSSRVSEGPIFLQEPSIRGVHLMLLKSMYALQLMRQNDAYLYLGHATRTCLVLGLHRAQVTDGRDPTVHRLRLTFWTTFFCERISSLYMGRPSSLSDRQIDTAYPEDLPPNPYDSTCAPMQECAFIRAMGEIAKLADRISIEIYSPASIKNPTDLDKLNQISVECDHALQAVTPTLPSYLHFFDDSVPIGEPWQEIQRLSLGFCYYVVRMLLSRPALVLTTFFSSVQEAQIATGCTELQSCINSSTSAARNLIHLAHDVYFRRFPDIRYDGALASFLLSASLTLLYDVLNLGTDPDRARQTFTVVEKAIKCLDEIEHTGYTSGKALSLDLMRVAKQAVQAADPVVDTNQVLMDAFPWLDNWASAQVGENPDLSMYTFPPADVAVIGSLAGNDVGWTEMEGNHLWSGNGFEPNAMPGCLF
ncbi:transcriptional regulator family: Fungal Specific TF [Aspergillus niger]|nr:transcriptional regulator family: Fungal Specific TF [Aspergillus niger]KAI2894857.1 transcriptional regulator family: Fungal Specific TF [Aspergillus niger]KAI2916420.1 transcriptional regulator family: Fungal Specific TF [Aspergillus niger]KAI2932868.1 transcriptional regulator family: Fungal Specific TF [Aspergillus niger]KAI2986097.1 transcriptional regulator family: Fungal Specific TF [Aspergillus niger]